MDWVTGPLNTWWSKAIIGLTYLAGIGLLILWADGLPGLQEFLINFTYLQIVAALLVVAFVLHAKRRKTHNKRG